MAWEGRGSDNLKSYYFKRNEVTVEEGCLLRGTRLVIPVKYQELVLALESSWNCAHESVSALTCLVANTGH